jgi:hypothetical protein
MKAHTTTSSRTDCKDQPLLFQDLGSRKVVGDFSGGTLSSDGGVLLLRQVDQRLGLSRALAACFEDKRDRRYADHRVEELVAQRLLGLALGYEDLNDHDQLRLDPLLAVACQKRDPQGLDRLHQKGIALAGASTLNRLELSNSKTTRYHKLRHDPAKVRDCLLQTGVRCLPKHAEELVIDLDAMGYLLHGLQEGRHFHAHYNQYCYLPLYAFVGDIPLWAQLRTSDQDGAAGVAEALAYLLLERMRTWGLHGTELERSTVGSVRLKLLKVAAQVSFSVRRVYVQLSSAYPLQALFRLCHRRLTALVPATG